MNSPLETALRDPEGELGIGRAIRALLRVWLCAVLVLFLVAVIASVILAVLLLAVVTGYLLYQSVQLVSARSKVLDQNEVAIWNGSAKLVSWNPTEGVVFLRNKRIDFVDHNPHDGGGIRVVYPFFGEELVLRVPLEIQTLNFHDAEVLTKEYVALRINGAMYWKIVDLSKFYLSISREVHFASDHGSHRAVSAPPREKFEVAEHWLRSMAEEKTRMVVSRVGTGLLISDQLVEDLPKLIPEASGFVAGPQSSPGYRTATESLATRIQSEFESTVREYGLEIHRVALQEIKFPAEIYAAAVEACKASYLPLKARAEALERKLRLQAEADVIGSDAVGLKEIAANIPALAFQDVLAPLFLSFARGKVPGVYPAAATVPSQTGLTVLPGEGRPTS